MTYEATLLVFGILLLLVGLIGKVKAKELEIGTDSTAARAITGLVGVILIVISLVLVDGSIFSKLRNASETPSSTFDSGREIDQVPREGRTSDEEADLGPIFEDDENTIRDFETQSRLAQLEEEIHRREEHLGALQNEQREISMRTGEIEERFHQLPFGDEKAMLGEELGRLEEHLMRIQEERAGVEDEIRELQQQFRELNR
jgi:hypothetical protein